MIRRKRHYRWGGIGIAVVAIALGTAGISSCRDVIFGEPEYIEYHTVVSEGETLWDKCYKVNDNREDVRAVIYRTMKENNISDAGMIMPGTKLVIHVKKVGNEKAD